MAATIKIKRGASVPTTSNLEQYELGWNTDNKSLYINDGGTVRAIASKPNYDLIWENDNVSAGMGADDIEIQNYSLSDYNMFGVIIQQTDNIENYSSMQIFLKGMTQQALIYGDEHDYGYSRKFTFNETTNKVTVSTGYRGSSSTNTLYAIPYQIYGIK